VSLDNLYYRKDAPHGFTRRLKALLKNRRLVLALILGIPVLIYVVFGQRGILQRLSLEREKTELQGRIKSASVEEKKLEKESKQLDNDPQAIEKVAREKHNMVREGDRVYKMNPEKK
jgi:cell division protein FtsB